MTKQEARKIYLEKRLALSETDFKTQSLLIVDHFIKHIDFSGVSVLHTFLPLMKKREPDTSLIIRKLQQKYPVMRIAVPKVNSSTNTLDHFYLEKQNMEMSSWGIPEPEDGERAAPVDIDLVIVPLLAFDKVGHRVGYGKGFYDKFLEQCHPTVQRVGLSFFDAIEKVEDAESHDIPLTACVTPERVYTF